MFFCRICKSQLEKKEKTYECPKCKSLFSISYYAQAIKFLKRFFRVRRRYDHACPSSPSLAAPPASPIGATLDLLRSFENGPELAQ